MEWMPKNKTYRNVRLNLVDGFGIISDILSEKEKLMDKLSMEEQFKRYYFKITFICYQNILNYISQKIFSYQMLSMV